MNGEVDGTNKDFPATHYDTRRKPRRPYSNTLNAGEIVSFPSAKTASTKRKRTSGVFNSNGTDVKRQTESFTRNSIVVTTKDGHDEYSYLLQDQTELHRNGLSIFTGLEAQLIILDCIFLVCEPPSEPYYLGRIMEFTKLSQSSSTIDAVRVNWFYRPRDIQRQQIDARLVFATMHSDLSPLSSIRGKCQILHRSQIENLDLYRTKPDSFFYERLFDKFMRRQYEVLPVDSVINVPEQVRRVLQARWKFVVVEVNRGKELAMEHRACRRCNNWCSSKDSVRCAICKADFHMQCVQPPLPRKPTRGFAWSCTPCSRAEAKRVADSQMSSLEVAQHSEVALHTNLEKADRDSSVSASDDDALSSDNAGKPKASHNASATICDDMDCARPELWPYRYLGIHCNINDAIDHDDRIYPRAASRIGQKHQATVPDWPGRHIEYFERLRRPIKRTAKAMKGKRSDERASLEYSSIERLDSSMNQDFAKSLSKQTIPGRQTSPHGIHQARKITEVSWHSAVTSVPLPADRPAWLLEKPLNYVARGEGATSACLWKPSEAISDSFLSGYLVMLQPIAKKLKVDWHTSNLLDIALTTLYEREFDAVAAIQILTKLNRKAIGEPTFSADETSRFQASVKLNGSELSIVAQDVGTRTVAECVRFYYAWKKTPQGAAIWRNSDGRKPKAEASQINVRASGSDFETLGDSSDDSAYSTKKATKCRRSFQCKFCTTTESRRWRRAPGGSSNGNLVVALCERCARLWRKYAATWEPPEEIFRKLHDGGYKAKRKRFEEELLKELPSNGSKPEKVRDNSGDQVKCYKKSKKVEKESRQVSPDIIASASCMVCCGGNSAEYRTCTDCGLQVHPGCYGVDHSQGETSDWRCDTCLNDISPAVSTVRMPWIPQFENCAHHHRTILACFASLKLSQYTNLGEPSREQPAIIGLTLLVRSGFLTFLLAMLQHSRLSRESQHCH